MNHERMSFLDFFAGIGTIRIGFEQAGWTCNGHVEWDKFAQASYNAMHEIKEDEYCGWDITKVRADELPRADLWAFGAPCQDFSIAGNRQGLKGERSSLVHEIFRLVEETPEENKPTWLLYENVKGMLSSNGGWDFLGILLEMDRLGYDVEWQLLNSKHFGVPQNRERVFTLGHLRGRGGRKVFPIEREGGAADDEIKQIGQYDTDRRKNSNRFRVYSGDGVAPTIGTMGGGGLEPCVAIPVSSPTLTTKCGEPSNSAAVLMKQPNFRIRKLTPKECWRLQGIPDHYFDKASAVNSDSQLYKQAGNACTVNVIYEVARRIGREETT